MNVTPQDRQNLDALLAEIHDPTTTPERREECRDDYSSISEVYVMADILGYDGIPRDPTPPETRTEATPRVPR